MKPLLQKPLDNPDIPRSPRLNRDSTHRMIDNGRQSLSAEQPAMKYVTKLTKSARMKDDIEISRTKYEKGVLW